MFTWPTSKYPESKPSTPPTSLKYPESMSRCTWTWIRGTWVEVALGGKQVHLLSARTPQCWRGGRQIHRGVISTSIPTPPIFFPSWRANISCTTPILNTSFQWAIVLSDKRVFFALGSTTSGPSRSALRLMSTYFHLNCDVFNLCQIDWWFLINRNALSFICTCSKTHICIYATTRADVGMVEEGVFHQQHLFVLAAFAAKILEVCFWIILRKHLA